MTIRDFIRIVEGNPRHGADGVVPDVLYHGTSLQNYLYIKASDQFEQDSEEKGNHGFSTTEDESVAIWFARSKGYDDRWGVVLTLDGAALASAYTVEPFHDEDDGSKPTLAQYEWEWVVLHDGPLKNANRFITEVRVLDPRGDPNHLMPWSDVYGLDRAAAEAAAQYTEAKGIEELRKTHTADQARVAMLGLAVKVHTDTSFAELRKKVAALDDATLYKLLWSYGRRVK
jgi:hypothetical protein